MPSTVDFLPPQYLAHTNDVAQGTDKTATDDMIKAYSHTAGIIVALSATLLYVHYSVCGTVFVSGTNVLMNGFTTVFDASIIVIIYALLLFVGRAFRLRATPCNHGCSAIKHYALCTMLCVVLAGSLACVWYSRFFGGYIHVSALSQTQNLVGLGDSIRATLKWSDLLLCGVVLALAFLGNKKKVPAKEPFRHVVFGMVGIICSLLFYLVFQTYSSYKNERTFTEQIENDWGGYAVRRDIFIYTHGFSVGLVCDILHSHHHIELTDNERHDIAKAIDQPPFTTLYAKPKRIIFIIIESLISDIIGLDVDGCEITPTLNLLSKESLYFSRVQSQIHNGYSSDGQFIYFTGLLPMQVGFTVAEYGDNAYAGLATAAKQQGYHTLMINPATHDYWRQDAMCRAYGIDRQYAIEDYLDVCGKKAKGEWLDDEEVFDFAYQCCLKHQNEATFTTILTSTMHYPYDAPFAESGINPPRVESKEYAHYLQKAHYTDRQLCHFLTRLESVGILDDAAIVICSDHHTANAKDSRNLPLMIVARGVVPASNNTVVGQIDIYPTMLNLMGYRQCRWKGLGQTLLSPTTRTESFDEIQRISELIIQSDYLKTLTR